MIRQKEATVLPAALPGGAGFLLIDTENIGSADLIARGCTEARRIAPLAKAVAVLRRRPGKPLVETIGREGVELLTHPPDMPRNCADALLAMAALREAVSRTLGVTDFFFLSDDADFGGVAAVLHQEGFRCWRLCKMATANNVRGFDGVICLADPSGKSPHPPPVLPMPENLLPSGRRSLGIRKLAARLRADPELQGKIRGYGRKLSRAIRLCALANNWPVVVEGKGEMCRIRRVAA